MAKYSDIKGFTVQTLSSDPVASAVAGGTWASGGNLNTGRGAGGGCGIQTGALTFAGDPIWWMLVLLNQEYNGP